METVVKKGEEKMNLQHLVPEETYKSGVFHAKADDNHLVSRNVIGEAIALAKQRGKPVIFMIGKIVLVVCGDSDPDFVASQYSLAINQKIIPVVVPYPPER